MYESVVIISANSTIFLVLIVLCCFCYSWLSLFSFQLKGKKGQQLVEDLERGYRLPQSAGCPKDIHEIMKKCWEWL